MKSSATGKKRFRRTIGVLAMVSVLALLFSFQGLLTVVISPVAIPLVRLGSWISDQMFWWQENSQITSGALQALYNDREALAILTQEIYDLREENKVLRAELGFTQRAGVEYVAASVLSKSISHSVSRFVIDAGTDDGAQLGAAVVSGEAIYVGKITNIGKRSATVSALTDPSHSVAVSLLNESRTIGVATGTVGDLLQIDFIPTDDAIAENDLVVTSGLESLIPSGLIVGVVNTVTELTGAPFQQAIVEPLSDIRRLSVVLILNPTTIQP